MAHRRAPAEDTENHERDLFRARLDEMIDLSHPLVRVSRAMPWETLIESVGESLPLVPAGPGRRPLPARLVLGLLYWADCCATLVVKGIWKPWSGWRRHC